MDFEPVPGGEVPAFTREELSVLSNDVKNLWRYFRLVTLGSKVLRPYDKVLNPFGGDLTLRFANPGPLNKARWVTLASRVLIKYVFTHRPATAKKNSFDQFKLKTTITR